MNRENVSVPAFTPFFNSEVKAITPGTAIMHISEGFLL